MESTIKVILYVAVIVLGIFLEVNKGKRRKRAAEARRVIDRSEGQKDYYDEYRPQQEEVIEENFKPQLSFWDRMEVKLEEHFGVDSDHYSVLDEEEKMFVEEQPSTMEIKEKIDPEKMMDKPQTLEAKAEEMDLLFYRDEGDLTNLENQPHGKEQNKKKKGLEKIDPELLIIYSELLKPKYTEF